MVPSLFSTSIERIVETRPFDVLSSALFPAAVISEINAAKSEMEFGRRYRCIDVLPSECQFLARSGLEDEKETLEEAERSLSPMKLFAFSCAKGEFEKLDAIWSRCDEEERDELYKHKNDFVRHFAALCDDRDANRPVEPRFGTEHLCLVACDCNWDEAAVRVFRELKRSDQEFTIVHQWLDAAEVAEDPLEVHLKFQLLCELLTHLQHDLIYGHLEFLHSSTRINVPERSHTPEYTKMLQQVDKAVRKRRRIVAAENCSECAKKKIKEGNI